MIPVVWKSYHDSPARGYWDQEPFEWLFRQKLPGGFEFEHHNDFVDAEGIVLVNPGHWTDPTLITADLARYRWVLLMMSSDEHGLCPFWDIQHPNLLVWRFHARPNHSHQPDRYLPLAWPPGTLEANIELPVKTKDWLFAGQVTHSRRREAVAAMKASLSRLDGTLFETDGFTKGWPQAKYWEEMRSARVVLCPSGPNHPDCWRMGECLESGGVPIIDRRSPAGVVDPWQKTFVAMPPFPIIDDWPQIRRLVPQILADWPTIQHRSFNWWQQEKRGWVWQLHDDLVTLSGSSPHADATERITALMPTSPISRHPDTTMIWDTIRTIRERLPLAEILVMIDGVRPEQEHYRERYDEYKTRLLWEINQQPLITPVLFDEFSHQANMTRRTLEMVKTPLLLFVEHDTPLMGDIPFRWIGHHILSDRFNWVRFHWDTRIHPEHEYLMVGEPYMIDGIRYQHTKQWSQRPHLARTDRYREWVGTIATTSRTMIEDAMYGPCVNSTWDEYQHAVYVPEGNIQRSGNFDGRGDTDPKYEMIYQ